MGTANVVSFYEPTALIAGPFPVRHRSITLASGANVAGVPLPRGTVLGRITASDKYTVSKVGANDGSQIPVTILAADTDASATDMVTTSYFEGEFAGEKMTFDASWTIATLRTFFRQVGSAIYVRSVGQLG